MTRHHPNDGTEAGSPPPDEQPQPECLAIVEPADAGPELCTIYSIAPDDSLVTAWVSAHEGSYCTLDDAR